MPTSPVPRQRTGDCSWAATVTTHGRTSAFGLHSSQLPSTSAHSCLLCARPVKVSITAACCLLLAGYLTNFGHQLLGATAPEEAGLTLVWLLDLWNRWATHFLVVFSLMQQLVLLFFAGVRRHKDSGVNMGFLWLAYQLVDYTTTYALGNLAIRSAPHEHQLVAFWAPFLLLHLGGPYNITAYSLEDNKLWERHFLTLVAQVLGAGYVLYKHISDHGTLFVMGAAFMMGVGAVKFWERTWFSGTPVSASSGNQ